MWTGDIRELTEHDAEACEAVIRSLPYFFGKADGIANCAEAVRSQRGLVAVDRGGVVGFLTYESQFPASAEITWMAVHRDFRRTGVGRRLLREVLLTPDATGWRMVFVITLGPSSREDNVVDGYAGTRAFYEAFGFVPLTEVDAWGTGSPGLILARPTLGRSLPGAAPS